MTISFHEELDGNASCYLALSYSFLRDLWILYCELVHRSDLPLIITVEAIAFNSDAMNCFFLIGYDLQSLIDSNKHFEMIAYASPTRPATPSFFYSI